MDVIGISNNRVNKLQWKMTQELRELWNSLEEDSAWNAYQTVDDYWREVRKTHGHGVKLWVGKLHQRGKFIPGKVQNNSRVPYAVSLLILHRKSQKLSQFIWWEDWQHEQEFHDIQGKDYNRIWDWRNPLSTKIGTTNTVRIEL